MNTNRKLDNRIEWSVKLFFLMGFVLSEFILEDPALSYYVEPESLVMLSILVLGSFYCYFLCPFGIISELFEKLGKKLLGPWRRKIQIPSKYDSRLRWLKYVFGIYFLGLFLFTDFRYFHGDHLGMYLSTNVSLLYLVFKLALAISVLSFFFDRFFCRYLCYQKAWYNIVEKFSLTKIARASDHCITGCKACNNNCPMKVPINRIDTIRSQNDCISCYKCVNICPGQASAMGVYFLNSKVSVRKFILISATAFFGLSWMWKIFEVDSYFGRLF